MLVFGWGLFWMFLSLTKSGWSVEVSDKNEVIWLQNTNDALSECTAYDEIPVTDGDTIDVMKLNSDFRLCCEKGHECGLCLVIDATLHISPDKDQESGGQSGADEEYPNEENDKGMFPVLLSGPTITHVINHTMNWMELLVEGESEDLPSLCVQYEKEGICQRMKETTIPLQSLAPCMCFQAWFEEERESMRTLYCPFNFPRELQENMHQNLTVDVHLRQVKDQQTMLFWNLSAPCRLKGEVRLCSESTCLKSKTDTEQLSVKNWEQTQMHQWVNTKIEGMFPNVEGTWNTFYSGRWRWSLLVVGSMLLICLTAFMIYFFHDFIKKWVQSYHRGKFVPIALQPKKGHVVLVSPPKVDDGVSESVRHLGSLLCQQGFSVSVDHWSRTEQGTLGPLPWLHSQMLKVESMGGRCVLILTQETKERTQDWSLSNIDGNGPDQPRCPYSDLFYATLFLIQKHKQQNMASERFTLVALESNLTQDKDRNLPELLCKLPLFHYPTQTGALLADLTSQRRKSVRTWTWPNFMHFKNYKVKRQRTF
uniref:SEFIR domain-containing protein n=1 Tax=Oryzias melastigma TaxID=30732 RepID=A0A3B3BH63_ORYME